MIKIESDKIKCPGCGKKVFADIYETEEETLLPTEDGFHVFCSEDFEDEPCDISYEEGFQLQANVYQWLVFNLRKLPFDESRLSN